MALILAAPRSEDNSLEQQHVHKEAVLTAGWADSPHNHEL
jgi:hypothetical protein